ncbi:MAG: DUF2203 domain-containing protein [Acidobacteriota bacterium]
MKLFTIDEASELLPVVRQILYKIKMLHDYASQFKEEARSAAIASQFGGGMPGGSKYVNSLSEIGRLTTEIDEMGIQLKDYQRGLIDFPFMRDGRLALLCWQFEDGEEILWWHDFEAGFAGRQRL